MYLFTQWNTTSVLLMDQKKGGFPIKTTKEMCFLNLGTAGVFFKLDSFIIIVALLNFYYYLNPYTLD